MLDHATPSIAIGSKLGIDATKKLPGEGFKRPWPPLIKMDAAVKQKIDQLFNPMKEQHLGSDFDDFLKQDGALAECEAGALKRVVAWQIEREMKRRRISRAKLASRMKTSPATLDRLFAPDQSSVTIQLLEHVALALGRKLKVELA